MKQILFRYRLRIAGLILGSAAGFLYWRFVGCSSGSCAITSDPLNSSLYGAFSGAVLLSFFETDKKQKTDNEKESN